MRLITTHFSKLDVIFVNDQSHIHSFGEQICAKY